MKLKSGTATLRAAIVDLDGTMIDTLGDFEVALNQMLHELRLPAIERATIEWMVGKGSEHLVQSVLEHVGAPAQSYDAAWEAYQRHYLAVNGAHARVYPGVVEGLAELQSRGLKLACLTNKPTAFALPLLAAKGLAGYFSVIFGGDAFERKKPHPLPLLRTCAALSSLAGQTLMLGDSSNDAAAARAAGCPVVLVTYGYNHGQPVRGVDADGYVDSLAELQALL